MKLKEVTRENLMATLSHPGVVARAIVIARGLATRLDGEMFSPGELHACVARAVKAVDTEALATAILAYIADPREGQGDQIADSANITRLCERAITAAITRALAA